MGSDSGEQKYYPSQQSEDEKRPLPPSQRSSILQPFVLTETVFRITTQRPTHKISFIHPLYKQLKPRPQYK